MAAMEKPLWSLAETKERVRLSLRESFPLHFGDRWEEARRIYLDVFRAIHLERLTPAAGPRRLLRGLAADGIFLGVVSNKTGALLRREAEQIGWSELFGSVVGAGDATLDKPDAAPVALALAAERHRAPGRECGSSATPGSTWNAPATAVAFRCCSATERPRRSCSVAMPRLSFADGAALFHFVQGL